MTLTFLLADRTASQAQLACPGLPFRRANPGFQGNVHLEQGELQRHPVGDAHTAEIEETVAIYQEIEVVSRGAA